MYHSYQNGKLPTNDYSYINENTASASHDPHPTLPLSLGLSLNTYVHPVLVRNTSNRRFSLAHEGYLLYTTTSVLGSDTACPTPSRTNSPRSTTNRREGGTDSLFGPPDIIPGCSIPNHKIDP